MPTTKKKRTLVSNAGPEFGGEISKNLYDRVKESIYGAPLRAYEGPSANFLAMAGTPPPSRFVIHPMTGAYGMTRQREGDPMRNVYIDPFPEVHGADLFGMKQKEWAPSMEFTTGHEFGHVLGEPLLKSMIRSNPEYDRVDEEMLADYMSRNPNTPELKAGLKRFLTKRFGAAEGERRMNELLPLYGDLLHGTLGSEAGVLKNE